MEDNSESQVPYDELDLDGKIKMIEGNILQLEQEAAKKAMEYIVTNKITSRVLTTKQQEDLKKIADEHTHYIANMKIQLRELKEQKAKEEGLDPSTLLADDME